jgi:hypothetical protein
LVQIILQICDCTKVASSSSLTDRAEYSGMGLSRPTRITDKSDDVYHDYLNIVVGCSFDATKIQWRLNSAATFAEYETWESYMVHGFA